MFDKPIQRLQATKETHEPENLLFNRYDNRKKERKQTKKDMVNTWFFGFFLFRVLTKKRKHYASKYY